MPVTRAVSHGIAKNRLHIGSFLLKGAVGTMFQPEERQVMLRHTETSHACQSMHKPLDFIVKIQF